MYSIVHRSNEFAVSWICVTSTLFNPQILRCSFVMSSNESFRCGSNRNACNHFCHCWSTALIVGRHQVMYEYCNTVLPRNSEPITSMYNTVHLQFLLCAISSLFKMWFLCLKPNFSNVKKYFYKRSFSDESYTQGLCVLWRILDNFAWAGRTINSPYTLFCSHSR